MALDPKAGLMYWSEVTGDALTGSIEYAWMDGTNQGTLINATEKRQILAPRSLTIDYREKKLYWCDPHIFHIQRVGLDGSDHENVLRITNQQLDFVPYSMAYHNQYVFWYDAVNDSIRRMHVNATDVELKPG